MSTSVKEIVASLRAKKKRLSAIKKFVDEQYPALKSQIMAEYKRKSVGPGKKSHSPARAAKAVEAKRSSSPAHRASAVARRSSPKAAKKGKKSSKSRSKMYLFAIDPRNGKPMKDAYKTLNWLSPTKFNFAEKATAKCKNAVRYWERHKMIPSETKDILVVCFSSLEMHRKDLTAPMTCLAYRRLQYRRGEKVGEEEFKWRSDKADNASFEIEAPWWDRKQNVSQRSRGWKRFSLGLALKINPNIFLQEDNLTRRRGIIKRFLENSAKLPMNVRQSGTKEKLSDVVRKVFFDDKYKGQFRRKQESYGEVFKRMNIDALEKQVEDMLPRFRK